MGFHKDGRIAQSQQHLSGKHEVFPLAPKCQYKKAGMVRHLHNLRGGMAEEEDSVDC